MAIYLLQYCQVLSDLIVGDLRLPLFPLDLLVLDQGMINMLTKGLPYHLTALS